MTTTRLGPFELVDPPTPEAEHIARAALEAIRYPWPATLPTIRIEWDGERMGTVSGLYYSGSNRVVLSDRPQHLDAGAGFVLAHELGHMIDDEVLDDAQRAQLLALMHVDPPQLGHFNHDHPDAGHHADPLEWSNGADSYVARVYEAFADLFVATYAPTIWDGTAGLGGRRYPRFVHWSDDVDAVRAIVTPPPPPAVEPAPEEDAPMFRDVGRKHPHRRAIERAVRLGLIDPVRPRLFRPRRRVSRGQLAEALVATYDKARRAGR